MRPMQEKLIAKELIYVFRLQTHQVDTFVMMDPPTID